MPVDVHNLSLFGLDLSRYANYVRAGWHELMWGDASGIRRQLDVPVKLLEPGQSGHSADEAAGRRPRSTLYIAGQPVPPRSVTEAVKFRAVRMPTDQVLVKNIRLPVSLELELEETLSLEALASSPFPPEATCYGWAIRSRDAEFLNIVLAIAEQQAVHDWLEEQGYRSDENLPEVWVFDPQNKPIVLAGFGEARRYQEYSRRLRKTGAKVLFIGLCIVLLAAVPGIVRKLQTDRMEVFLTQAEQESGDAQALREELLRRNAQIAAINALFSQRVDYHRVLDYLSQTAPDSVYLQRFEADGRRARLTGWADNAGAFMQTLGQDAAFGEVSTSSAFSSDARTGMERFVLELQLPESTPASSGN